MTEPTRQQAALWANRIQRACLEAGGDDVDAALVAADYIVNTQPYDGMVFADDLPRNDLGQYVKRKVSSPDAQELVDLSLNSVKKLIKEARRDLDSSLRKKDTDRINGLLEFTDKYRLKIGNLLTVIQLVSALEGMRTVASGVPSVEDGEEVSVSLREVDGIDSQYVKTINAAVKELSKKGMLTRESYDTLVAGARTKAYTVAGVQAQDTLGKIRDAILKDAGNEVVTYAQARKKVLAAVDEGTILSAPYMDTLTRATVQTSFSDGQLSVLNNSAVRAGFPYVAYDAVHDDNTREDHLQLEQHGLDGTNVYRADDPVFRMFRPPWDFNCRCNWTPLTLQQATDAGVTEAKSWLESGVEPAPTYVRMPNFAPSPTYQRETVSPLALSMESLLGAFGWTGYEGPRGGRGWRNTETSRVVYQSEKPDERGQGAEEDDTVVSGGQDDNSQDTRSTVSEKISNFIDKIPGGKYVREKAEQLGKSLEERYGSRTASAIITSAKIVALGATVAAIAGFPTPYGPFVTLPLLITTKMIEGLRSIGGEHAVQSTMGSEQASAYDRTEQGLSQIRQDNSTVGEGLKVIIDRALDMGEAFGEGLKNIINQTFGIGELVFSLPEERDSELPKEQIHKLAKNFIDELMKAHKESSVEAAFGWIEYQGPKGGHGWQNTDTGKVVYQRNKPGEADGQPDEQPGPEPAREPERPAETGGTMEKAAPEPRTAGDGGLGKGKGVGPGPQTGRNGVSARRYTAEQRARFADAFRRIDAQAAMFARAGYDEVADWYVSLKDQIVQNGIESLDEVLGEMRGDLGEPTSKVQYKGTGYFAEDYPADVKFLKDYLDHTGVIFLTEAEDPTGDTEVVATAPIDLGKKRIKPRFRAADTNFEHKLEESKALPGLETSEDIETLMGKEVPAVTGEVMSRLDEVYGKGKWIIKSYGDESYAGFGILFPQRIKEIKRAARQTIVDANNKLKKLGFSLARGEQGGIVGVKGDGIVYRVNTPEYANLDKKVRKIAKSAIMAAPDENGARLPVNYEDSLEQDYGINLRRDENDKVIGIITPYGEEIDFKTKEYKKFLARNDQDVGIEGMTEHVINRAVYASRTGNIRFMAQPAFQAVGVTAMDRAVGNTWETSTEGRVHVVTEGGRASVVPYATLANRGDTMPVVFPSKDSLAMEAAVQRAIDALPESERSGQVYAPDVIKTKNGWEVVELNASSEAGQSMWLEENPLVIDAFVSHLNDREPSHVRFVRSLINSEMRDKVIPYGKGRKPTKPVQEAAETEPEPEQEAAKVAKIGAVMSTDVLGHEHKGKGPGGGQFVSKGESGNTGQKPKLKKPPRTVKKVISDVVKAIVGEGQPPPYSAEKHEQAINIAKAKYASAPHPTLQEIADNLRGLEEKGANTFRRDLVGNSTDRKNRRIKLLKEFGDGEWCPCIYCGKMVTHGTMEQDKIYTTAEGGRYRMPNLVPSCSDCNKKRGDDDFDTALQMADNYYAGRNP